MNSFLVSAVILSIVLIDTFESRTVYNKFDELQQQYNRNNENSSRGRIKGISNLPGAKHKEAIGEDSRPIPVVNYEYPPVPKLIQPSVSVLESTFIPIIDKYRSKPVPEQISQYPLRGQQSDGMYKPERERERKRKPKIKEIHVHEHENIALHYHKFKPMEHYIVTDHNYEYGSTTRKPNQSVNQNQSRYASNEHYDESLNNLPSHKYQQHTPTAHNNYNTNRVPKRGNSLDGPTKLTKYKKKPNSYNNLDGTNYDQIPQNTYPQDYSAEYGQRIQKKPQKYYNTNTNHTSSYHYDISNNQMIPEKPTSSSASSNHRLREKPNRYHDEMIKNGQTIPERPAASKQKPTSSSNNNVREKPYRNSHKHYPPPKYDTTSNSQTIPKRPLSSSNNHVREKPYRNYHTHYPQDSIHYNDYTTHDYPRDDVYSINIQHPIHHENLPSHHDMDVQDYPREPNYMMEHTHSPQKYHRHKPLAPKPYREDKEDYTVRVTYSSD